MTMEGGVVKYLIGWRDLFIISENHLCMDVMSNRQTFVFSIIPKSTNTKYSHESTCQGFIQGVGWGGDWDPTPPQEFDLEKSVQ